MGMVVLGQDLQELFGEIISGLLMIVDLLIFD